MNFPFIFYLCNAKERTPGFGISLRRFNPKKESPVRFVHIILLCAILGPGFVRAQGLRFRDSEAPIDQRTSYTVFAKRAPSYTGSFDLEFDLSLYPETKIGYILRVKNEQDRRIYNLFYDGQGSEILFRLNDEGRSSLITASLDPRELTDVKWFRMKLTFDLQRDSIGLMINNRTFGVSGVAMSDRCRPEIVFGRSDHIIDVPSFAIRNLTVGDRHRSFFGLSESRGGVVHDARGHAVGSVASPIWLINDAYHWRFLTSFTSSGVAGANYNPRTKEFYYFNRDTLFIYDLRSGQQRWQLFPERCPVNLKLGTNFIDAGRGRLYAYEVYTDQPVSDTDCSVASLDLNTGRWSVESHGRLPMQLHHHGAWFDAEKGQYTLFGGFGNMRYNKTFYTYDLNTREWTDLGGFGGDSLCPRYFCSVGYSRGHDQVYIFGGMGNESGEQVVERYYFYDLYRVDLSTHQIHKLWRLPWKGDNVVPVRGMVISEPTSFYTLCYPEIYSDSYLRLYRFSIEDGAYEILGDSIPIRSDKITTNANLYYDASLHSLYATVQEFDDDIRSSLKIYVLSFPPITAEELAALSEERNGTGGWIVIAVVFLSLGLGAWYQRRRMRRLADKERQSTMRNGTVAENPAGPNSIYLFGDFTVYDRNNRDITYLFSTRLRQMFCLVLQYSAGGGIPSPRLSGLMWPDRPESKTKNIRGVTLNHLRKALGELDGVELLYSKGCFRLVQTPPFYCDYTRCFELLSTTGGGARREELVRILSRGKFLKSADHPIYDLFKAELEQALEPSLTAELAQAFDEEDYVSACALADAVFHIDPLSETALSYLIRSLLRLRRSDEARRRYQKYASEYEAENGREYPVPFKTF